MLQKQGLASSTSLSSSSLRPPPQVVTSVVCALCRGQGQRAWPTGTPTLEEAVVGPWAETAGPHIEGVHHHGQQLLVLEAPRQHLQNERLLLGAQGLGKKQPGRGEGAMGQGQAPGPCWGSVLSVHPSPSRWQSPRQSGAPTL